MRLKEAIRREPRDRDRQLFAVAVILEKMVKASTPEIMHIQAPIIYPESDGKPLSDNTKQFELITVIQGNIDSLVPIS